MFKRRDFNLLHGEGDESSSSSDEDLGGGESSSREESEDDLDDSRPGRLEDLSEEEEDEQDEEAVEAATGPPWKCALCPGVLLLKEETVAQHAASKRHLRALAALGVVDSLPDPVYAAKGPFPEGFLNPDDSEGETHAERMVRVRDSQRLAAAATEKAAKTTKRRRAGLRDTTASRPAKQGRSARRAAERAAAGLAK